ncbi:hypothetical protein SAMN04515671_4071 [Nakamurella panacisegetis]|uniref:Flagellar basal body-associated protein FliL n=1 Tax=Nakamurella panacisegetis TaxID=1090615 RepID=A0A1H0SF65_9ACTN|nr:hypothetical protein [Nakamurella panacisegetis]SDP40350.1 hypothetical protein SAMN04515671_4071 [Nakamurella panacisegetis]
MSENYGPQNPYGQTPGGQPGWQPQGPPGGRQPGWQPQGPPSGGQPTYGTPSTGAQPQYGQPPAQPQYGQPPAQPQYGQPQYGQPGYGPGQPQYGQPASDVNQPSYGQQFGPGGPGLPTPSAPVKKSHTALIVTVVAVVVALLAGGGIYWFGIRDTKSAGGQASPQEAANAMLVSLSQKDPIGVADQLDPAEASLFSDLNGEFLTELKRLQILQPSASATSLTGSKITVSGLTYGATDQISDHEQVVTLTGGTVTVTSDPSQLPVTDKIKNAAGTALAKSAQTKTYNIADEVKKLGHPIRIATVNRNGKWYPSLFYTAADYWAQSAKVGNPTSADYIAPAGGSSPEDAMNQLLSAATSGDYTKLIALLPPQEMGVMHDYGKLIVGKIPASNGSAMGSVKFSNATWNVTDVAGGKKVSLKTLTVTAGSQTVTVKVDGSTLTVSVAGQPDVVLSKDTIGDFITSKIMGGSSSNSVPPQVLKIAAQEFQQLLGLGVVMTQDGNSWYVSPVRSYAEIFVSLLKGLEPADVDYLLTLAKK